MGLLRRKQQEQPRAYDPAPVGRLWAWWSSSGRASADAGLAAGHWGTFIDDISRLVREIDPGLAWETSPGRHAKHSLVITSEGSAALRPLAERVLRAAPPPDEGWEFHAARQRDPRFGTQALDLGRGHSVDLSLLAVSTNHDPQRDRVDVTVRHPDFAHMSDRDRVTVAFLSLDWLLGEDDVERWIGEVAVGVETAVGAVPFAELAGVVDGLAAQTGGDTWVLGEGSYKGRLLLFAARRPLKWIDDPLLDLHITVTTPFVTDHPAGFPTGAVLDRLRAFEDQLVESVGDRGLLVAHQTSSGSRTLHLYADQTDNGVLGLVQGVAAGWPGARVKTELDPGWAQVAAFA